MANELRLRGDYVTGVIDDAPLLFDDTIIHSAELVILPPVDNTQHLVLELDPTGIGNGPETVWVTAHTAGEPTVTVLRGMEGTTAVQHEAETMWAWGPVASDYIGHHTDASRPEVVGSLPYFGQQIDVHDAFRYERWDGTKWGRLWAYGAAGRTGCSVKRVAAQSVPTITDTRLKWDTPVADLDGFQTAEDELTVPAGLGGLYGCTVVSRHAANASNQFLLTLAIVPVGGIDQDRIFRGGRTDGNLPFDDRESASFVCQPLEPGDKVTASVVQTTGGNTDYYSRIDLYRIGG